MTDISSVTSSISAGFAKQTANVKQAANTVTSSFSSALQPGRNHGRDQTQKRVYQRADLRGQSGQHLDRPNQGGLERCGQQHHQRRQDRAAYQVKTWIAFEPGVPEGWSQFIRRSRRIPAAHRERARSSCPIRRRRSGGTAARSDTRDCRPGRAASANPAHASTISRPACPTRPLDARSLVSTDITRSRCDISAAVSEKSPSSWPKWRMLDVLEHLRIAGTNFLLQADKCRVDVQQRQKIAQAHRPLSIPDMFRVARPGKSDPRTTFQSRSRALQF